MGSFFNDLLGNMLLVLDPKRRASAALVLQVLHPPLSSFFRPFSLLLFLLSFLLPCVLPSCPLVCQALLQHLQPKFRSSAPSSSPCAPSLSPCPCSSPSPSLSFSFCLTPPSTPYSLSLTDTGCHSLPLPPPASAQPLHPTACLHSSPTSPLTTKTLMIRAPLGHIPSASKAGASMGGNSNSSSRRRATRRHAGHGHRDLAAPIAVAI